jgi:molecular chaperone GrpE
MATLKADLAKLTAERNDLNDRLLRLAAEFENYKRRIRKDIDDAGLRTLESVLKELLAPLDNLDRAIIAAKATASDAPGTNALLEGILLVQKQFFAGLEKFQVKPFDPQGEPFNPQFHEGISQVDSDTLPPGSVATVFARGYMAGSRLLRPAMVTVVRGRKAADPVAGSNDQLAN